MYDHEQVIKAFRLYSALSRDGVAEIEELREYLAEDMVRGLVDQFAKEVDCTVLPAGDRLYLVPLAVSSPYHVKNATIKKEFLGARAKNIDLYMMYLAIIVLFGEFYDSFHTNEMTRNFIIMGDWLQSLDQHIHTFKEHSTEKLQELDREYEYNWSQLVEKWDALDDLKESTRQQDGRTVSRLGFLSQVQNFLLQQGLIETLGNLEITLTEKAKTIIQRYYMEVEYHRGILDFISGLDRQKEGL